MRAGFQCRFRDAEGDAWWETTIRGNALAQASFRRPITRKTAERHLATWIRRAINVRGHFPTVTAALKCVSLAIISLDPTGRGRQRWSNRWKEALNAFEITFNGRLSTNRK
jgi:transposase-like protein